MSLIPLDNSLDMWFSHVWLDDNCMGTNMNLQQSFMKDDPYPYSYRGETRVFK